MLIRLQRSMRLKVANIVIVRISITIVPVHKVRDVTERLVFILLFFENDLFETFEKEMITYYRMNQYSTF